MGKKDKILDLLGKKSLTDSEKDELESLAGSDKELSELRKTYEQLESVVSHSSHLSEEELSQYTLYKNGMVPDDSSIIGRIPFIETHLRKCAVCSGILREFNLEYSDIDSFLSESIVSGRDSSDRSADSRTELSLNRYKAPRYAFASIIIVGLVYLALYVVSSFTTPAFYNNAAISSDSQFSINRGRATENFQNSLKALENHNYDEAISYLQKDIKENSRDETIFYSYYIMGLSYLKTAEHDFLGLFPGYNQDRASKGAEYLEESIRKNDSGRFNNIKLNSYFYLAKASLMLKDKEGAKHYLTLVINGKGSKMEEAKYLLGEME